MMPVKLWQTPKILGECRIGIYYINDFTSLRTDPKGRTIWLDLSTKNFKTKSKGALNFEIKRISAGKRNDFSLCYSPKLSVLFFEIQKIFPQASILEVISLLKNPEMLGEENQKLILYIKDKLSQIPQNEIESDLENIGSLVSNLRKESFPKLLNNVNYTLVLGSITEEEDLKNTVGTQGKLDLKRHSLSVDDLREYFGGIVLGEETIVKVFQALGLSDILSPSPRMPRGGGAIFIDMGGTGKSMMKTQLIKFWQEKLEGECVEKNGVAEFDSDINYAKLISSWYKGSSEGESPRYDKEGLEKAALRTNVPSLLIVDEADRFVKVSDDHGEKDRGAEVIITEFKKYLTRSAGGSVGLVITLFIANVEERHLNHQISQGGERLTPVYFGPPTSIEDWLDLIDIYFKSNGIIFTNRDRDKDIILADLLLTHNRNMSEEGFMIPPRKFSGFCDTYKVRFNNDEKVSSQGNRKGVWERLHSRIMSQEKETVPISYFEFIENLIEYLLIPEVRKARADEKKIRSKYDKVVGNFIKKEAEIISGPDSKEKLPIENISSEFRSKLSFLLNNLHRFQEIVRNNTASEEKEFIRIFLTNMSFLKLNSRSYFENTESEIDLESLDTGFERILLLIGKLLANADPHLTQNEGEIVSRFIIDLGKEVNNS